MNKALKPVALALLLVVLIILISLQVGVRMERARCSLEIKDLRARLAQTQDRLRDWPELSRYAGANAQTPAPQAGERRVVFIGDSITDSWSREEFGGFFPGKPYINRGISGQVTEQMLARFRQDVIALSPQAVVILGGTNDIGEGRMETTFDNLVSMAELASLHHIAVILASVTPVNDYGKSADGQQLIVTKQRPPGKIKELNNRIKEYAARSGFTYLDYYAAMVDDKDMLRADLSDDGLHPNAKGYAVMTPLAEEAISRALNSKLR